MKTKMVPWWENWVRYFVFMSGLCIMSLVVVGIWMFLMFFANSEISQKDIILATCLIIGLVVIPFGTWSFFTPNIMLTPRRTLFKHEIKKGLVPFVDGKPVAFPRKEDIDNMEWKEPCEFEGIIYPHRVNGNVYMWAGDEPDGRGGEYMVRQTTFLENLEAVKEIGGVKGVWTWKWNRIDFVELVLVKTRIL